MRLFLPFAGVGDEGPHGKNVAKNKSRGAGTDPGDRDADRVAKTFAAMRPLHRISGGLLFVPIA